MTLINFFVCDDDNAHVDPYSVTFFVKVSFVCESNVGFSIWHDKKTINRLRMLPEVIDGSFSLAISDSNALTIWDVTWLT